MVIIGASIFGSNRPGFGVPLMGIIGVLLGCLEFYVGFLDV